jgi:DNA-directed RNA polymerase subunit RPC12/RpoP
MADITFECPECKQHLVIDAGSAGLEIPCPNCSQSITVKRKWKPYESKIIYICAALCPPVGLFFGILGIISPPRRKQGEILLCTALLIFVAHGYLGYKTIKSPAFMAALIESRAESGDAKSQCALGLAYRDGRIEAAPILNRLAKFRFLIRWAF